MAEPSQSRIINIPERFSGTQRRKIGKDIVEHVIRRTQSGLDVNNNLFAGYSKAYEKTGTVNLTDTEQMLGSLRVLSHGKGFIKIGFPNSTANNKASYAQNPRGQKSGSPSRKFVGIAQADLNRILERYDS